MTAFLALLRGIGRALPMRAWLVLGLAAVALILAVWLFQAGREAEREAAAARAAGGRDKAGTERAIEAAANADKLEQWNHDAEQTPDTPPDARTVRRRCRQLREAGAVGLPECRGFEGRAQAGPVAGRPDQ